MVGLSVKFKIREVMESERSSREKKRYKNRETFKMWKIKRQ